MKGYRARKRKEGWMVRGKREREREVKTTPNHSKSMKLFDPAHTMASLEFCLPQIAHDQLSGKPYRLTIVTCY